MAEPFLALITPLTGPYYPAHPIAPGGPPPGIWPSPGHPEHPIAPGGPPPVVAHPIPPNVWPDPLPPDNGGETPPPTGPLPLDMEWHTVWSASYGWALVGVPMGTSVAPSDRKRR